MSKLKASTQESTNQFSDITIFFIQSMSNENIRWILCCMCLHFFQRSYRIAVTLQNTKPGPPCCRQFAFQSSTIVLMWIQQTQTMWRDPHSGWKHRLTKEHAQGYKEEWHERNEKKICDVVCTFVCFQLNWNTAPSLKCETHSPALFQSPPHHSPYSSISLFLPLLFIFSVPVHLYCSLKLQYNGSSICFLFRFAAFHFSRRISCFYFDAFILYQFLPLFFCFQEPPPCDFHIL